uniref:SFRICE_032924 n=1 Tax=Spodoptera frugiperda TaxID=7108 RepID=A0A2H1WYZ4_SPOFR
MYLIVKKRVYSVLKDQQRTCDSYGIAYLWAALIVYHQLTRKTSSLISISEALVPVIYSPVYSKVYLTTLSTMPGAFYLISASLAVPAIAIYLALFTLRRKDEREQATPEPKPKENEITRF